MPEHLYQRQGVWYARVQVGGVEHRRSLRTDHGPTARKRLRAFLDEVEQRAGSAAPVPAHSWEEAVVAWEAVEAASLRPATRERYASSLTMLEPHMRGRDVGQLQARDFHAYAQARMRAGASAATVRRDLTIASRVMAVAMRGGHAAANPAIEEWRQLKERREPIQPVPLRQIADAIRIAPPGLGDMIRFLLRTGCRQEEAGSLERSHVDLARMKVTFARTKTRSPRVIEIDSPTARVLRQAMARSTSPYVFTNRRGERFAELPSRFRDLIRRSLDLSPRRSGSGGGARAGRVSPPSWRCHDLRHTHAIRALQRGVPIYELARRLGHSTVKTTEVYAGWLARPPE